MARHWKRIICKSKCANRHARAHFGRLDLDKLDTWEGGWDSGSSCSQICARNCVASARFGRFDLGKLHGAVARSTFVSQNAEKFRVARAFWRIGSG